MLFYLFVLLLLPLTEAVPSEVTGVMLSVASGQTDIRVDWNKPSSDRPIIRYEVEYGELSVAWIAIVTVQGADSLTTVITNLDRGTEYIVRIRAVSDAGNGYYNSPPRPTLILPSLPSQVNPPTITIAVSSGKPALTVSWSAPQSDSTITKYELQYRKTPSGDWMSRDVTSASTTLSNLDAGTEYAIRVRAVSDAGEGPFSNSRMQTTFSVPSVVTGVMLSVVSGQAAIIVTWHKPSVEGTFIRYDVQYRTSFQSWDASTTETVVDHNVVTVILTNLQRGTSYNVRVRAVSNVGNGPYSTAATSMLQTIVPLEVTGVSLSVVAIEVSWNKRSVVGNFIRFEVEYKTSPQSWDVSTTETVVDENVVTVDLTNLQQGTTYNVRVRAVSDAGNGPYSIAAIFTVPNVDEEAVSTSPLDSNVGVTVGVFVAGLVAGVFGLLLVEGIVFGACKLTKQPNKTGSKYKESGSDSNAVEMTQSPAYESVGKAYEDVDHPTQRVGVSQKINEEYAIIA